MKTPTQPFFGLPDCPRAAEPVESLAMSDCPGCKEEVIPEQFPYGSPVKCPHCGRTWETEMEESFDGDGECSLVWWFTGEEAAS